VESPYDKENNQSGNVEISNQGAFSSGNADGWSQTKKDSASGVSLSNAILISGFVLSILNICSSSLSVSGKDKAANQAETVKADDFTIDKTRPVITVTYDNNNA